mmetsp:Transcript_21890/g.68550  ORF Transcript_21890/g.68550 Transcript_21890/m.68550 type:complete len:188 (+) Transcript_21890:44-607(+)
MTTTEPEFKHALYSLRENGTLQRKATAAKVTSSDKQNEEEASLIEAITTYVQAKMRCLGLVEHWIPDAEEEARCNIFVSNLDSPSKLLLILQNQVGSKPGIWSRSLCLTQGLEVGSMLSTIERALNHDFAVVVLNPNTNSVYSIEKSQRIPIPNSFSPENHVLHVWDNLIAPVSLCAVLCPIESTCS